MFKSQVSFQNGLHKGRKLFPHHHHFVGIFSVKKQKFLLQKQNRATSIAHHPTQNHEKHGKTQKKFHLPGHNSQICCTFAPAFATCRGKSRELTDLLTFNACSAVSTRWCAGRANQTK
ncbi:MAG: hypothetical protein IJ724_03650 [Muribaculaceae bacterium]|nr:hypothetical protein [Muribaculaceae bacterium]